MNRGSDKERDETSKCSNLKWEVLYVCHMEDSRTPRQLLFSKLAEVKGSRVLPRKRWKMYQGRNVDMWVCPGFLVRSSLRLGCLVLMRRNEAVSVLKNS